MVKENLQEEKQQDMGAMNPEKKNMRQGRSIWLGIGKEGNAEGDGGGGLSNTKDVWKSHKESYYPMFTLNYILFVYN